MEENQKEQMTIEKTVDGVLSYLNHYNHSLPITHKDFKGAMAGLPQLIDSLDADEQILHAILGWSIKHGIKTVNFFVALITTKNFRFAGVDGQSSIFLPNNVTGYVNIGDIHAITTGNRVINGPYLTFEVKNENYMIDTRDDMELIKRTFEKAIKLNKEQAQSNSTGFSSADEIKKYKELLDAGIITQREFDAKKKQLLGL